MLTTHPAVTPLAPATFVFLDIETGDAPAEAVAAAIEAWKAPSNWKPETVESKRAEAAAKIVQHAALLDAAPLLCIAVQMTRGHLIFNGMDRLEYTIDGWPTISCGDERGLLLAFRVFLDGNTNSETVMVGHNLLAFDLPKIRHAYIRHRLRLPEILRPKPRAESTAEAVDTVRLFKAFSTEHRDEFCPSLDVVATTLGIERPKQHMNGADCPRLYREGQIQTVLTYCAVDVATIARAYQLMTASAPDLN